MFCTIDLYSTSVGLYYYTNLRRTLRLYYDRLGCPVQNAYFFYLFPANRLGSQLWSESATARCIYDCSAVKYDVRKANGRRSALRDRVTPARRRSGLRVLEFCLIAVFRRYADGGCLAVPPALAKREIKRWLMRVPATGA